ncbi:LAGLIDADG family homing endonuclease, partial [Klebsiella pneumoniae]
GAYNKKIPAFLNGYEKSLMPLIKGFFRGDGHIDLANDLMLFTTVSPAIAYQITSILAANNILSSINEKPKRELGNYDT